MDEKNWKEMFDSMEGNRCITSLLETGIGINALDKSGITMLTFAAECGKLDIAEFLVKKGADVDIANADGSKPLHIAAQNGYKDIVNFFLDIVKISADSCDNNKYTPLHYIAAKRHISSDCRESCQELVHILMNREADLDAIDRNGCTPLLLAAQNSCKHLVELFIKLGSSLELCDENQWTILHHACQKGWSGVVQSLLEGRFDIDLNAKTSAGDTPATIAVNNSHEDIAKVLFESGAEGDWYTTILGFACTKVWLELVKSIVSKGCNHNPKDRKEATSLVVVANHSRASVVETLLHFACKEGWLELVESLVSKGCDLNAKDQREATPLVVAANHSHPSVVKYLLKCGADADTYRADGQTLLHFACEKGWLGVVKSLVSKGCDLNPEDLWKATPLVVAANNSHQSVVKYLLESGADADTYRADGQTLLHFACEKGWLGVVKSLVSKGCDLNPEDLWKATPLVVAANNSHRSVVKYLLECGADADTYRVNGQTLLHFACEEGWLGVVKSLVSMECDLNSEDLWEATPLVLAANHSHPSVVKYLLECGADADTYRTGNLCGQALLHFACEKGWLGVVKSLVSKGCDLNVIDCHGKTPVLYAAQHLHSSIIDHLVDSGADLDYSREGRIMPLLHHACMLGWFKTVKLLIEKGFDVNTRNYRQDTPLHTAACIGSINMMKRLIKAGADINVVNMYGKTPLPIYIGDPRNPKAIELLLRNGAYFQAQDCGAIHKKKFFNKNILQNPQLCTMAVLNKFNNDDLREMYEIPGVAEKLPSIEKLKIASRSNVAQEIAESVNTEIQSDGYCDVLDVRPIALKRFCVLSLVKHYSQIQQRLTEA